MSGVADKHSIRQLVGTVVRKRSLSIPSFEPRLQHVSNVVRQITHVIRYPLGYHEEPAVT